MIEEQKKGTSNVKYLWSKDKTLEDNDATHLEPIKQLPADDALEASALNICIPALLSETK